MDKEYYVEQIKQQEKTIELLKLGFEVKMGQISKELLKRPSVDNAEDIVREMRICKQCIDSVDSMKTYYEKEYEKMIGEPYSKYAAREKLFLNGEEK